MKKKIVSSALCLATTVAFWSAHASIAADAPATTAPATTSPTAIDWSDAGKHVGETVTVTGPVVSTHATTGGKSVSLNVGKEYPSTDRFTVFVTTSNAAGADDTYKGKTVTVTGKVILYKKAPEIKVDEKDVKIGK